MRRSVCCGLNRLVGAFTIGPCQDDPSRDHRRSSSADCRHHRRNLVIGGGPRSVLGRAPLVHADAVHKRARTHRRSRTARVS